MAGVVTAHEEKKVMNRGRAKSKGYNRKKIVAQVGINERRQ